MDSKADPEEFGTGCGGDTPEEKASWYWHKGGVYHLDKGEHTLELKDLTGLDGEDFHHVSLHDVFALDVVQLLIQDGNIDFSGQDIVSGIGTDDALREIFIQERPGILRLEGPFIAVRLRKSGKDGHHSQQQENDFSHGC